MQGQGRIDILSVELIGNKTLKAFYIQVQDGLKVHRSPIVYGGRTQNSDKESIYWTAKFSKEVTSVKVKLIATENENKKKEKKLLSQICLDAQQFYQEGQGPNNVQYPLQQRESYFYSQTLKGTQNTPAKVALLTYSFVQIKEQALIRKTSTITDDCIFIEEQPQEEEQVTEKSQSRMSGYTEKLSSVVGNSYEEQSRFDLQESVCSDEEKSDIETPEEKTIEQLCEPTETVDPGKILISKLKKIEQYKLETRNQYPEYRSKVQFQTPLTVDQSHPLTIILNSLSLNSQSQSQKAQFLDSMQVSTFKPPSEVSQSKKPSNIDSEFSEQLIQKSKFVLVEKSITLSKLNTESSSKIKLLNVRIPVPVQSRNLKVKIQISNSDNIYSKTLEAFILEKQLSGSNQTVLMDEKQSIYGFLKYRVQNKQTTSVQSLAYLEENPEVFRQTQRESGSTHSKSGVPQLLGNKPENKQVLASPNKSLRGLIKQKKLNSIFSKKQRFTQQALRSHYGEQSQYPDSFVNTNSLCNSPVLKRTKTQDIADIKLEQLSNGSETEKEKPQNKIETSPNKMLRLASKTAEHTELPKISSNYQKGSFESQNQSSAMKVRKPSVFGCEEESSSFHSRSISQLNVFGDEMNESRYGNMKRSKFQRKMTQIDYQEQESADERLQICRSWYEPSHQNNNSSFRVQIVSINVIAPTLECDYGYNFALLKSQSNQMAITEDQENSLTWKNKSFTFKDPNIEISLFCRSRDPASRSSFLGSVKTCFLDFIKNSRSSMLKTNLIDSDLKVAGSVVICFKMDFESSRRNPEDLGLLSDEQRKVLAKYYNKNQFEGRYKKSNSKMTLKKNTIKYQSLRRRSLTESSPKNGNQRTIMLPSISKRVPSKDSHSRQIKVYGGGKNIIIGKSDRFSTINTGGLNQ